MTFYFLIKKSILYHMLNIFAVIYLWYNINYKSNLGLIQEKIKTCLHELNRGFMHL